GGGGGGGPGGREEARRGGDRDGGGPAAHALEVLGEPVRPPAVVADDLVDRVGEEESAIERRDARFAFGQETAVQIDGRHGAECYQRRFESPNSRTARERSASPASAR